MSTWFFSEGSATIGPGSFDSIRMDSAGIFIVFHPGHTAKITKNWDFLEFFDVVPCPVCASNCDDEAA